MNYREAQLLYPQDMTNGAGTVIIDVDVQKPISRINIKFKTTKKGDAMDDAAPANIPKIELVDGSTVLHALTGRQNQALAYYSRPFAIMDHGQHNKNNSEEDHYVSDFGRWLWDEQLAFNPLQFHNPQLKISYDENLADTTVEENELSVWADIFDEKQISPLGFLMAVEQYAYTPGANNSFEIISLPSDRPIRQILVRAHQETKSPWYSIKEARLDEGTLDTIPWDYTDLEDYYRRMKGVWRRLAGGFNCGLLTGSARVFYIAATDYYATVVALGIGGSTNEMYETLLSSAGGYCSLQGSSGTQVVGEWSGYLPWHCFQFPLGKQDVIEDWYNPEGKMPRLRLRAGTGGVSGDVQVVLEELYKY